MNYSIYNENGLPIGSVPKGYIAKFINPDKEYDVDYWIDSEGNKHREWKTLKGKDLTENQIWQLFLRQAI